MNILSDLSTRIVFIAMMIPVVIVMAVAVVIILPFMAIKVLFVQDRESFEEFSKDFWVSIMEAFQGEDVRDDSRGDAN